MGHDMDDFTKAIAAILKAKQQEDGQPSYTQIAARTTMSRPTVERILNGRRDITARYLREMCGVLGLDPAQVVDDAEQSI